MDLLLTILLVVLAVMLVVAVVKALFWLAAIALAIGAALLLWRRVKPKVT